MIASSPPHRASELTLVLTPGHQLRLVGDGEPAVAGPLLAQLAAGFERGTGHGLLHLGGREVGTALPPVLAFWRGFAARYVTARCTLPDESGPEAQVAIPLAPELFALATSAPPMTGGEYLTPAALEDLWRALDQAFATEFAESGQSVQDFLKSCDPAWNRVGRLHFNLAENRQDAEAPFAFLITYSTRLSAQARAQHLPLAQALREYSQAADRERLLALLAPLSRAADQCAWLKAMVDAGEIYHPLRWTPRDVVRFLTDLPVLEQAGIVVRMPAGWNSRRPPRPKVTATVGSRAPAGLGTDALLDFEVGLTLDGQPLTRPEIDRILSQTEGLALVRGQWVEVDADRLGQLLASLDRIGQDSGGLGFGAAMRLLAGADEREDDARWSEIAAGPWLAEALEELRDPGDIAFEPGRDLSATLRPYQQIGARWLFKLASLRLGACLADDMGLGKTIQVLALLVGLKARKGAMAVKAAKPGTGPSLLVAPASLLANWAQEAARFAPALSVLVAHPSAAPVAALDDPSALAGADLVLTTYGQLLRHKALVDRSWNLVVLDEAQAIKNPDARQTRMVKQLRANARIALTGTPVENRASDLWSLFDFLNPGLLGTARDFATLLKRLEDRADFGPLRELVRPYILRRLKTDRSVIADLPDKTEVKAYCHLSSRQAALYQQAVADLEERLATSDGIARKGLVLAFLMRLKQLCNHPSQWLGDGAYEEQDSGKWARLREIADVVGSRQEKMLVFTQFREATGPLAAFLGSVFGRAGLVLHGQTPVKQRQELVRRFQDDETLPFFVLSLKAGGSGLNLTAASHVVHFDRWWNPAVEDQATDRAFRIGQRRNVMVHKFVCKGTLEEKIDQLIDSKRDLSRDLLQGGAEALLTELPDEELMAMVALDLESALSEAL